jgi:ribosomal protein L12E/L44/L45/RPP1/RPP2
MNRVIKLAALASLGAMLSGCPKNEAEAEPEAGSSKTEEAAEPAPAEGTDQAAEQKEEEGAAEEKKEDSGDGW